MHCPAQTQPDSLICPLQVRRGSWQEPLATAWPFGVTIPQVLEEEGRRRKRKRKGKCSPLVLPSHLLIAGMTQGEGHRNPLSLSCLGLLTPQSLPTSSSTAVPGVWVPGDPAAGAPAHQTPEKEAVAVPSLSEAVPLTTAFSVLTGKAIEQMA